MDEPKRLLGTFITSENQSIRKTKATMQEKQMSLLGYDLHQFHLKDYDYYSHNPFGAIGLSH